MDGEKKEDIAFHIIIKNVFFFIIKMYYLEFNHEHI